MARRDWAPSIILLIIFRLLLQLLQHKVLGYRLPQNDNIVALAKELGISRRLLYTWREKLASLSSGEGPPGTSREATLRKEVSHLKRVLAERVLEVDFPRGIAHRRGATPAE